MTITVPVCVDDERIIFHVCVARDDANDITIRRSLLGERLMVVIRGRVFSVDVTDIATAIAAQQL